MAKGTTTEKGNGRVDAERAAIENALDVANDTTTIEKRAEISAKIVRQIDEQIEELQQQMWANNATLDDPVAAATASGYVLDAAKGEAEVTMTNQLTGDPVQVRAISYGQRLAQRREGRRQLIENLTPGTREKLAELLKHPPKETHR